MAFPTWPDEKQSVQCRPPQARQIYPGCWNQILLFLFLAIVLHCNNNHTSATGANQELANDSMMGNEECLDTANTGRNSSPDKLRRRALTRPASLAGLQAE
jgi:hypothetical protein